MTHPFVGTRRIFTYPDYGTPDGYPELTAHTGQIVTVLRELTDEECDPECQPMFEFQASDGFTGHAHASELDGSVRPLRPQDYPHGLPTGSAKRYLSEAEIEAMMAERHKPDPRLPPAKPT